MKVAAACSEAAIVIVVVVTKECVFVFIESK